MKKLAIAALLSAFTAAPALAAEPYYIGINAGQNQIDDSRISSSTAFSVFGGYAFNEYIAGEISYTNFGSADTNVPGISVSGNAAALAAVGSLPLNNDFSLFARLGYASTRLEPTGASSETKSDLTWGVGGQYNATRTIGVRLAYDVYRVGETDTRNSALTSLGVLFRF